jgi:predicted CopG family antitoxin
MVQALTQPRTYTKSVSFTAEDQAMLDSLKQHEDRTSDSEMIRSLIRRRHREIFSDAQAKKAQTSGKRS